MMLIAYKNASKGYRDYGGCVQWVIAGVHDALGIRNNCLFKAGSSLAGGIGNCTDGVCGCYSAGAMIISLFFGRTRQESGSEKGKEDRYIAASLTAILHDRFIEKYDSITCAGVQKKFLGRHFNLRNKEEVKLFLKSGAPKDPSKCPGAVGDAAKWTLEIILIEMDKRGLNIEGLKKLSETF